MMPRSMRHAGVASATEEERRLARSGLADDVQVAAPVGAGEVDRGIQLEATRRGPDLHVLSIVGHGSPSEPGRPSQRRARVVALLVCGAAKPGAGGGR